MHFVVLSSQFVQSFSLVKIKLFILYICFGATILFMFKMLVIFLWKFFFRNFIIIFPLYI